MQSFSFLIWAVIVAGLAFDFVNGFHDASNSIATIVATRVLTPRRAVMWAASFNVVAMFVFGTGVAQTVGSGLVALDAVTPLVVLCGLIGATFWGIVTWKFALPISSSHALLGGFVGSAMANSAFHKGWRTISDPVIASGWMKIALFIVVAPLMGALLSVCLMKILLVFKERVKRAPSETVYRRLQLLSSAFLSLMHGSNDAQKTAGILTGALVAGGNLPSFDVPYWVLVLSYGMMGLGTLCGGWRIVRTMGQRLTPLDARGGVCAETAAALSILGATLFDLPVSTTQVTTGAILGVGAVTNPHRVRWKIGRRIAWAWIVTIPASAFVGGCVMAWAFKIHG